MHWRDEAIVLGTRRHGESSLVLEVFTRERGRCLGLIRGGRSPRNAAKLQAGNGLDVTWRARLDEHLGNFQVEPVQVRASGLMETPVGLNIVQTLSAHARLLPERDPHPDVYVALEETLDSVLASGAAWGAGNEAILLVAALAARFELIVLDALGFGLDLSECALTGTTDDLAYVSPKTGRAASRDAAAPWSDRLLVLPAFLVSEDAASLSADSVRAGLKLTGHFLAMHVWGPRGLQPPMTRDSLIGLIS